MDLPEVFGYVAAGLVLATFTMRTMVPLRLLGISSNIAFIAYGYAAGLLPVLILHAILLPLNIYRLIEIYRLVKEVENAATESDHMRWLLPFMTTVSAGAGSTLFHKGDPANEMYVITSGRIRLEEFGVELRSGEMVGEVGVFSPDGRRIATATCVDDCRLQRITRNRVRELVFQEPRLAFHLIGVVTGRFVDDLRIIEERASVGS